MNEPGTARSPMFEQLERDLEMLDRHFEVLRTIDEEQPIGIINLSSETGHPRHKVRYSLRVLQNASLVEPSKNGAITTDGAGAFVDAHEDRLDDVIEQLGELTPGRLERGPG